MNVDSPNGNYLETITVNLFFGFSDRKAIQN